MIRAKVKNKQRAYKSILEAMVMLRKSWDEVSERTIKKCFRKGRILMQSQESAMGESDDTFKGIAKGDHAIGELEFDLNQLHEVNPELALDDLHSDGLIDIGADLATNNAQPSTVEEF